MVSKDEIPVSIIHLIKNYDYSSYPYTSHIIDCKPHLGTFTYYKLDWVFKEVNTSTDLLVRQGRQDDRLSLVLFFNLLCKPHCKRLW